MKDLTRKQFLLSGAAAFVSASAPAFAKSGGRPVRFGVVTDSHSADTPARIGRRYRDSLAKMRQAVDAFNDAGVDFAIELGDLKDMGPAEEKIAGKSVSRPKAKLRDEALRFLDAIESEFARFKGPRYHVLGNHDMDCLSKEDFLAHTENHGAAKGKTFYAFMQGGVTFIVLDGCFNPDKSPYRCGNFDWRKAFLADEELTWLDGELASAPGPAVVFCHQLLDGFSGPRGLHIGNWKRAVAVMEKRGNVLASIQGHHHPGHYNFRNGIYYWTMKGMINGKYPEHNSYAIVEISPDGTVAVNGFGDCESRVLTRISPDSCPDRRDGSSGIPG